MNANILNNAHDMLTSVSITINATKHPDATVTKKSLIIVIILGQFIDCHIEVHAT